MTVEILPGVLVDLPDVFPESFMIAEESNRWLTYPAPLELVDGKLRFTRPCHDANCSNLEIESAGSMCCLMVYVGGQPRFRRPFPCRLGADDELHVILAPSGLGPWEKM